MPARTHCIREGHELTPDNVYMYTHKGKLFRSCAKCRAVSRASYNLRRKRDHSVAQGLNTIAACDQKPSARYVPPYNPMLERERMKFLQRHPEYATACGAA